MGVGDRIGLKSFAAERRAYVQAALDGAWAFECGDGTCDPGESCDADCGQAECPPCQVFAAGPNRCVPSCADACTCPVDAPVELVCNPTNTQCEPAQPPCDCGADEVCLPHGGCAPRCAADSDCPPQIGHCDPSSGLCS